MLALASLKSLCPSSRHANTGAFSSARGCPCWRWPPGKAFVFRHATPTGPGFPAPAVIHVGVGLPAKPLSFASPRQQGPYFPRRRASMLALASPQSLCPSPRNANTGAFSSARGSPYWRWPPRKAFVFRHATPTGPGFSVPVAAHVGVGLLAKPFSFVSPRQQDPHFPRRRALMLALASPQSLCPSPRHANRARIFRAGGSSCWRGPPRKAFVLRHATPTPAPVFIACLAQKIMLYLIRYFKSTHKI